MQGFTNNKGSTSSGHCFTDQVDQCDTHHDIVGCAPTGEQGSNQW
jgi:hypothetical protein